MIKNILAGASAAALVLATSAPAFAGGFVETNIEPDVFVVDDAPGSLGSLGGAGIVVGVLALAALVALASSDDSTE